MADVKFLVYFTCFCLYQDLVFCDEYGESGNKITLNPVIRGKPEEILWTHNGNKVLEYDGKQMDTYGSFKDRVELDFETGQLTIIKLNNQDSGTYLSEIVISKKVHTSSHTLTVLDALPEPQVTCEVNKTSNVKKLSCSVESQTEPSYEWSGSDVKQPGPTLVVNEQEENLNSVYTCTVKSKAGSSTTDFNLQDCNTGRANPAVLLPVLIVILLLIILLAFYFYRRKRQQLRKPEPKNMDPEIGECLLRGKEEENKQTDNLKTAEGELEENRKNCDVENTYVKADETNTEVEIQKPIQTQKEKRSQILKNESEDREKTPEERNQTRGEQGTKDGDKNESEDREQMPEERNQTRGEQDTKDGDKNESGDREQTPEERNQTRGEQEPKDGDKNESGDREQTPEERNQTRGEQDTKDGDKNESEDREQTPEERNQTRGEQEPKDGDKNESGDHTPEQKK